MHTRTFDSVESLVRNAADLLRERFSETDDGPHAVMVSGGRTPVPIYGDIAEHPVTVSPGLYVLQSDERMVPANSPDNNFAQTRVMAAALGLADDRMLRVHTELPLREAAERYDREIAGFMDRGGRITLALLGLGPDGHTASLFTPGDLERAAGRHAVAVPRETPPDRVSVTPRTLALSERVVFLVAGAEKRDIVRRMQGDPGSVVAAEAVKGAPRVELWLSEEAVGARERTR